MHLPVYYTCMYIHVHDGDLHVHTCNFYYYTEFIVTCLYMYVYICTVRQYRAELPACIYMYMCILMATYSIKCYYYTFIIIIHCIFYYYTEWSCLRPILIRRWLAPVCGGPSAKRDN